MSTSRVDFSYAFGTPHRLTVARPDSGDKTLADVQQGSVRLLWTYDNLVRFPLAAYAWPQINWDFTLKPEIDAMPFGRSTWTRLDGVLPVLDNAYSDARGNFRLQIVGGESAAIVRIDLANTGDRAHCFTLSCASKIYITAGYNPAWIEEPEYVDTLLAGWQDRADRVLFVALGAEECTAPGSATVRMVWNLQPGQRASGYLVRPYRAYKPDVPNLRSHDWQKEFDEGIREWKDLLARAKQFDIPDPGVRNGLYASLADLFVMREPVAEGYIAGTAGTECYRAPNNAEPAVLAICLDQLGYHQEAEVGYRMCLDQQGEDGDWADPQGWANHWWSSSGFKAWAVIEHYKLTKDRAYLEKVYPRMLASSRFHERARSRTRKLVDGQRPLTYGLMPRGQGDCGLANDDDYYGVYYPHNFWPVFADACALEAAKILNRPEAAELERIYTTALDDLRASLEKGAISEDGYRWIPGAPGKTSGSRWGALNALAPCRILPADHDLITGTIRKTESRMSPGGIPVHTGWQKDGMWVAITLDNLAQALLVRGEVDRVAEYLYATLNHGTPLYTWCEERGQEPGDTNCTGDRQHLFTPVAIIRCLRDMFVMEDGEGLHLGRGISRSWLARGQPVGVQAVPTHFGEVSWQLRYDAKASKVVGHAEFPKSATAKWARVHIRLLGDQKIRSVSSKAKVEVASDGLSLLIANPAGKIDLEIHV